MKVTVDISMYPLNREYEEHIVDFILKLRKKKSIQIETNGMSTQLIGDYDEVMDLLKEEIKNSLEKGKSVFVYKVSSGERKKESIPDVLK